MPPTQPPPKPRRHAYTVVDTPLFTARQMNTHHHVTAAAASCHRLPRIASQASIGEHPTPHASSSPMRRRLPSIRARIETPSPRSSVRQTPPALANSILVVPPPRRRVRPRSGRGRSGVTYSLEPRPKEREACAVRGANERSDGARGERVRLVQGRELVSLVTTCSHTWFFFLIRMPRQSKQPFILSYDFI